jgi:hypothetical protein
MIYTNSKPIGIFDLILDFFNITKYRTLILKLMNTNIDIYQYTHIIIYILNYVLQINL